MLTLAVVGHDDSHLRAEHVEHGLDRSRELAVRRREKVVRRVEDGELGQQDGAPGVLVRAGPYVHVLRKSMRDEFELSTRARRNGARSQAPPQ